MKIATILFTYNRSVHTKTVLQALFENEVLPEKLFVFQDGKKESTNLEEWEKVNKEINKVSYSNVEVVVSQKNKGLADSIISGLEQVFREYDAVVVLEDDCVPHPKFMSYMIDCLKKYEKEKDVYSVSGYAWPIDITQNGEDAYFCQRFSSLGWGTWKDRWNQFERDYSLLKRILRDSHAKERLDIWGADLQSHLVGNITGKCDSWAVFWALKVIEKNGYCLSPFESLIENIGFDGTGVHSGTEKIRNKYRDKDNLEDYILPDSISCSQECMDAFRDMLTATPTVDKFRAYQDLLISLLEKLQLNGGRADAFSKFNDKEIAIWGPGKICDFLIKELDGICNVRCIIQSKPTSDKYRDIPVIMIEDLPDNIEEIIVIPFYDIEKLERKTKNCHHKVKLIGFDTLLLEAN